MCKKRVKKKVTRRRYSWPERFLQKERAERESLRQTVWRGSHAGILYGYFVFGKMGALGKMGAFGKETGYGSFGILQTGTGFLLF